MKKQADLIIGGTEIKWDLETGKVLFEGGDAVFFWVSAMKTLFETIKDISGAEATNLVLETTGYRQGLIVGEGFQKMKRIDFDNIAEWTKDMYASAGWGKVEITEIRKQEKAFTFHIQDDWELKMNKLGNKTTEGNFVPAHYAGVLSGLFGEDYWYRVVQLQNDDNPQTIVEYFPQPVNIQQNIRELSTRREAEQIQQLEQLVADKTAVLTDLVKELSSPVIPVLAGIVVVPLIGAYDEERAEALIVNTLEKLPAYKADYLLLDLTGLNHEVDEYTASLIDKLGSATNLLGTETILVGISADLALTITNTLTNLQKFECMQTLQHGIYFALGKSGRQIV